MVPPDEALKRLLDGNERYIQEQSIHPNRDQERRAATVKAQKPTDQPSRETDATVKEGLPLLEAGRVKLI